MDRWKTYGVNNAEVSTSFPLVAHQFPATVQAVHAEENGKGTAMQKQEK
jgi:hypothetical protein